MPRATLSAVTRRTPSVLGVVAAGLLVASCSHKAPEDDVSGSGFSAVVFAKRQHTTVDGAGNVSIDVAGGAGQVIDYLRYVPGGGVFVLSPARPDGNLTNLTERFPTADIAGIDLAFDAKQVVFSMKTSSDDHYHVYTVDIATKETHQKTFGDQDDVNPIYAPGGRIVFVTNQMFTEMGTRADEYNHGRVVTQLGVVTLDGGDADRKLCSQNLSHTINPFLRFDGSIGYSRWEHLGGVNDVKLFRMAPDCTQMIHVAGQFGKPSNSLVQVTEISPNVMVGVATDRERTIQSGAIVQIDSRMTKVSGDPGERRLDSENVKYDVLTPGVPTGSDPSPLGRYRNPRATPAGQIIASWADGFVNDLDELSQTAPDFGIYLYDAAGRTNQLVYNDRNAWDLYPIPLVARAEPPVIGSVQNTQDATKPAVIGSIDVKNTDLATNSVDTVQHYGSPPVAAGEDDPSSHATLPDALRGAVKVRVIEGFSSESAPGVSMFGLTMDEGAAVLGEATVYGDGSWLAAIPPYVPVHLQPIDKYGMSIRNQRLWVQGMPGEARVCGGCHESRTGDNSPGAGQNPTLASTKGAENLIKPVADRISIAAAANEGEYGWDTRIQKMLTDKCATCHNNTTNGSKAQEFYHLTKTDPDTGLVTDYPVPYLSFEANDVTVYYDRKLRTWPASYVSIFFPSTIGMMMGGFKIVGNVPPKWGVPESARASVLIEKLNIRAADGTWAWDPATHPSHPEDVNITLSDDERAMLVRVMDLGGQYYARQNTGFTPNTNDPVSGTKY